MATPSGNSVQGVIEIQDEILDEFRPKVEAAFVQFNAELTKIVSQLQQGELTVDAALDLAIREQLATALRESGVEGAVDEFLDRYADLDEAVREVLKRGNVDAAFLQADVDALQAIARVDLRKFASVQSDLTDVVAESIFNAVIGGPDNFEAFAKNLRAAAIRGDLNELFGVNPVAQVQTAANTAVAEFSQHMIQQRVKEKPGQKFVYAGPVDQITRPWCRLRLKDNTPKTVEEIQELKPSPSNPGRNNFIGRGGFNCRHLWRPVPRGFEVDDVTDRQFASKVKAAERPGK